MRLDKSVNTTAAIGCLAALLYVIAAVMNNYQMVKVFGFLMVSALVAACIITILE